MTTGRESWFVSCAAGERTLSLVKPTISMKNRRLWIEDGRHPVVEKVMGQSTYVLNSISLGPEEHILLTGANMSGKSTYMRLISALRHLSANRMFCTCQRVQPFQSSQNLYPYWGV